MGTVPIADLIAVLIGIAVVVMAVAASMASVIIVVAIVLLVAVSMVLGHSDCRREGQRQNCSRAGLEPGLNRHFTPYCKSARVELTEKLASPTDYGRPRSQVSLSFVYLSPLC